MAEPMAWTTAVHATINDPFDGVMRLVGDVQRFGFDLLALSLEPRHEGKFTVSMTIAVPDPSSFAASP